MANINNREQLPTRQKKGLNIFRKRLAHKIVHPNMLNCSITTQPIMYLSIREKKKKKKKPSLPQEQSVIMITQDKNRSAHAGNK
jgi:hypothetical protein